MSAPVLVAYASKYGSTQEVGEAIAETLRGCGLEANCQDVREVRSLDPYGAVILGAPLFIGSWYKPALQFLSRQRAALAGRPVAIFALGPLSREEKEVQGARQQLDKNLAKVSWLAPVAVALFAGKYDPATLRFPDNLLAMPAPSPLHGRPASDERDWDTIRAWAAGVAGQLGATRG